MSIVSKIWLTFCQATTILVAIFFVVTTLKPFWIEILLSNTNNFESFVIENERDNVKTFSNNIESAPSDSNYLRNAASKAMPSVVHIYTTQKKLQANSNLLLNDPFLKDFSMRSSI